MSEINKTYMSLEKLHILSIGKDVQYMEFLCLLNIERCEGTFLFLFLNCIYSLCAKKENAKKEGQNKKVLERKKNILYSLVGLYLNGADKKNDKKIICFYLK